MTFVYFLLTIGTGLLLLVAIGPFVKDIKIGQLGIGEFVGRWRPAFAWTGITVLAVGGVLHPQVRGRSGRFLAMQSLDLSSRAL